MRILPATFEIDIRLLQNLHLTPATPLPSPPPTNAPPTNVVAPPAREELKNATSKLRTWWMRSTTVSVTMHTTSAVFRLACAVSIDSRSAVSVEEILRCQISFDTLKCSGVTADTIMLVRDASIEDVSTVLGCCSASLTSHLKQLGINGLHAVHAPEFAMALIEEFGTAHTRSVYLNQASDAIALAGELVAQRMEIGIDDLLSVCEHSPDACVEVLNALKRVSATSDVSATSAVHASKPNVLLGADARILRRTDVTAWQLEHLCEVSFLDVLTTTACTPALLHALGYAY